MATQTGFLQTLSDVGAEHHMTVVFSAPLDLFSVFLCGEGLNGQAQPDEPVGGIAGGK